MNKNEVVDCMTDKELKKLRRVELLELLVEQTAEMEELRGQLRQAQQELKNREILLEQAGSIAEAALALNQVFEAADRAARDYVNSVKAACDRQAREHPEQSGGDRQEGAEQ